MACLIVLASSPQGVWPAEIVHIISFAYLPWSNHGPLNTPHGQPVGPICRCISRSLVSSCGMPLPNGRHMLVSVPLSDRGERSAGTQTLESSSRTEGALVSEKQTVLPSTDYRSRTPTRSIDMRPETGGVPPRGFRSRSGTARPSASPRGGASRASEPRGRRLLVRVRVRVSD